jgi:hypothetical protein
MICTSVIAVKDGSESYHRNRGEEEEEPMKGEEG